MSRRKNGMKVDTPPAGKTLTIGGYDFVFVGSNKGFNCTHNLFRSRRGGYLVSLTDAELKRMDYEKKNMPPAWTPGKEALERAQEAGADVMAAKVKVKPSRMSSPRLGGVSRRKAKAADLFVSTDAEA